jgi:hypothetical protein
MLEATGKSITTTSGSAAKTVEALETAIGRFLHFLRQVIEGIGRVLKWLAGLAFWIFLAILGFVVILGLTNPSRDAHMAELRSVVQNEKLIEGCSYNNYILFSGVTQENRILSFGILHNVVLNDNSWSLIRVVTDNPGLELQYSE